LCDGGGWLDAALASLLAGPQVRLKDEDRSLRIEAALLGALMGFAGLLYLIDLFH
jgi:hypothetical protein